MTLSSENTNIFKPSEDTGNTTRPKVLLVSGYSGNAIDIQANWLLNYLYEVFDCTLIREADNSRRATANAGEPWDFDFEPYDFIVFMLGNRMPVNLPGEKTLALAHQSSEWAMRVKPKLIGVLNSLEFNLRKDNPKVVLLHYGVDTRLFKPLPRKPNDKFVIGWAGMPNNARKNFETHIKPLGDIPGVELRTNCTTISHGSLWGSYSYHGLPTFYNDLDCYVCGSSQEGAGMPLLEVASCGRAIISTRVGHAPELLSDGGGLLVDDDPEAIQKAVEYLRDNRGKAIKMGRFNRKNVLAKWDWDVVVGEWVSVIRKGIEP